MFDSDAPGAFDALCRMRADAPASEESVWDEADIASRKACLRVRGGDWDDPDTWGAPNDGRISCGPL